MMDAKYLLEKAFVVLVCGCLIFFLLVGCQKNAVVTDMTSTVKNTDAVNTTPDQTTFVPTSFSPDDLKVAQLIAVLEAPVGDGEGELAYGAIGDNGIAMDGPNDFAVAANGDIYVLDNYHGNGDDRISVFSHGSWLRNIDFSDFISYGNHLTIFNDSLYVFDNKYYQGDATINKMTLTGELQEKYVFGNQFVPSDVRRLLDIDGKVVVASHTACYTLDNKTEKAVKTANLIVSDYLNQFQNKVTFGSTSWIIPVENREDAPIPIGKTSDNELFVAYWGNKYICKFNANGEPMGIVWLDELLKETVFISDSLYVAHDGMLYIMVGHPDALLIYRAEFS